MRQPLFGVLLGSRDVENGQARTVNDNEVFVWFGTSRSPPAKLAAEPYGTLNGREVSQVAERTLG